MTVFVSGGGTGGHFFPALALLECLLEKNIPALFVGSQRGIEQRLREHIPVESVFVPSHPFMGRSIKDRILALFKNSLGAIVLTKKLPQNAKGVVFGGYASLPLGMACFLKKRELYLHEQNSVPSQSNRLLSRFAEKIFITFEHSRKYFPKEKVVKTGLPVRKRLLDGRNLTEVQAREKLGLEEGITLLVMGGSQGANFLNRLAMEVFSRTGWQGIHITGERDYQKLATFYQERGLRILTFPFSHEMEVIYRASTLAISRAGASSITELSLYGIPTLFIPFPHAVYDHQLHNAKEIEELGGGFVLEEEDSSPDRVLTFLYRIMQDRDALSKNIKSFANPVACQHMLEYILKEGGLDAV